MYKNFELSRRKLWLLCLMGLVLGILSTVVAHLLLLSIAFFTNIFWFQRISFEEVELVNLNVRPIYILIPIIGGVLVGIIARFGSSAIRGHGIPEVMEKILIGQSRIPRRMTFLKPFSSALAIGSGGPFGAEGPIIATGASLGSWLGRHFLFSEYDRKILLSAGAAAGMTAIFGTPLSAVFICIELLLFEFSPKSFLPVIIAVSTAFIVRLATGHEGAVFPIGEIGPTFGWSAIFYFIAGSISGLFACGISKIVFLIEDIFEKLPIHWMWWPAIGGLVVGVVGYIEPRSLGVGYSNITQALQGELLLIPALTLFFWKFISWSVALGSGTSGGTLAPLLTFGSALGVILSAVGNTLFPELGITTEVTALICMSSMFSGATRAVLTSTVFALEATGAHYGIGALLLGNGAAYLISILIMKETIMTEKIARRGIKVPNEYFAQDLNQKNQ
jgi:CIC family chloride channel protein